MDNEIIELCETTLVFFYGNIYEIGNFFDKKNIQHISIKTINTVDNLVYIFMEYDKY